MQYEGKPGLCESAAEAIFAWSLIMIMCFWMPLGVLVWDLWLR